MPEQEMTAVPSDAPSAEAPDRPAATEAELSGPPSLRNRLWRQPDFDPADADALAAAGTEEHTAAILAARGVSPDALPAFLSPTLRALLPDPSGFREMDAAADRLVAALAAGEKIAIWSDYDVDGATSAALLGGFLRDCGHAGFEVHIPDRIAEGYGPNTDGLLALAAGGAGLIVVLDSGTAAHEPFEAARAAGIDIVAVDHHAAEAELPPALALVNPNRLDETGAYGHLCAAGMTFLLAVAVNLRLRARGWFDGEAGRPASPPELMAYLDLVALGTVCDVVPLTGLNRAYVKLGLPRLSERRLPGIAALAEAAACDDAIAARDCGFGLGPRINAGGRIGESGAGTALLLERDPDRAASMAAALDAQNRERQEKERQCTEDAMARIDPGFTPGATRRLAVAVTESHEGVVGISASRLKDALDAPAFVLTDAGDGLLKGSGRSVAGFDLGAAIIAARRAGLLRKGGGHAMAGGITLEADRLAAFTRFMDARIAESRYAATGVVAEIDAVVAPARATLRLVAATEKLAPFGMGNPTPRLALPGMRLAEIRVLKEKHLKCIFEDTAARSAAEAAGAFAGSEPAPRRLEALIWNAAGTAFGRALVEHQGETLDILGALEINEWNATRRVQIKLEDARPAATA